MFRVVKTTLLSVLLSLTLNTYATTMEEVRAIVDTEARERVTAADLPFRIEHPDFETSLDDKCQYAPPLHFTISALRNQSFHTLFSSQWTARTIVGEWDSNTDGYEALDTTLFGNLKTSLGALALELNNSVYDNLKFSEMVELRLRRAFPESMHVLDDRIDDLVRAGFQFPLFEVGHRTPVEGRLYLLKQFVPIRTSPTTGGLGNMTWNDLYYTPALPHNENENTGFPENVIYNLVVPMQGNLFPKASYDCGGNLELLLDANNKCCCNNSSHGSPYYRKCSGWLNRANCYESGGICGFMVTYCPPSHPAH